MLLCRSLFIPVTGLRWSVGATAQTLWFGVDSYRKLCLFCFLFFFTFTHSCKKIYTWQPKGCLIVYINHGCPNIFHSLCTTWDLNYIQMTAFRTICLGAKSQLFPVSLAVDWSLTWNAKSSVMYFQQSSTEKQLCLKGIHLSPQM